MSTFLLLYAAGVPITWAWKVIPERIDRLSSTYPFPIMNGLLDSFAKALLWPALPAVSLARWLFTK